VPLIEVKTTVLLLMARAKPKSHNFTTPFAIRMFYGYSSIIFKKRLPSYLCVLYD